MNNWIELKLILLFLRVKINSSLFFFDKFTLIVKQEGHINAMLIIFESFFVDFDKILIILSNINSLRVKMLLLKIKRMNFFERLTDKKDEDRSVPYDSITIAIIWSDSNNKHLIVLVCIYSSLKIVINSCLRFYWLDQYFLIWIDQIIRYLSHCLSW